MKQTQGWTKDERAVLDACEQIAQLTNPTPNPQLGVHLLSTARAASDRWLCGKQSARALIHTLHLLDLPALCVGDAQSERLELVKNIIFLETLSRGARAHTLLLFASAFALRWMPEEGGIFRAHETQQTLATVPVHTDPTTHPIALTMLLRAVGPRAAQPDDGRALSRETRKLIIADALLVWQLLHDTRHADAFIGLVLERAVFTAGTDRPAMLAELRAQIRSSSERQRVTMSRWTDMLRAVIPANASSEELGDILAIHARVAPHDLEALQLALLHRPAFAPHRADALARLAKRGSAAALPVLLPLSRRGWTLDSEERAITRRATEAVEAICEREGLSAQDLAGGALTAHETSEAGALTMHQHHSAGALTVAPTTSPIIPREGFAAQTTTAALALTLAAVLLACIGVFGYTLL